MRMSGTRVVAGTAALVAVTIVAPAAVHAGGLITGAEALKNGSVTTKDVKNGSLLAKDFEPGQPPGAGRDGRRSRSGRADGAGGSDGPERRLRRPDVVGHGERYDSATPTVIATLALPAGQFVITTTGVVNNAGTTDIWCNVGLTASPVRWISPSAGSDSGCPWTTSRSAS